MDLIEELRLKFISHRQYFESCQTLLAHRSTGMDDYNMMIKLFDGLENDVMQTAEEYIDQENDL